MTIEISKTCSMCNKTMDVTNFYKIGKYYRSRCKECYKGYNTYVKKGPRIMPKEHIEYIKEHYGKLSASQISLNLGYCSSYVRNNVKKWSFVPEDKIQRRGRPRKTVCVC